MPERVRDVMTTDLVTVEPTTSLQQTAKLMRDHNIGNVLVAGDDGWLHGIVTDRDLVVRALADGASGDATVGEYASTDLFTVGPDDAVAQVVALMAQRAVRRVPVVDDGRFVGIVSIGDLAEERDPESVLGEISEAPPNN